MRGRSEVAIDKRRGLHVLEVALILASSRHSDAVQKTYLREDDTKNIFLRKHIRVGAQSLCCCAGVGIHVCFAINVDYPCPILSHLPQPVAGPTA